MYREAETLERDGWKAEEPQPAALARMLAERGLKVEEAVRLAEQAALRRSDIFTMDALALAYFKAGAFAKAAEASSRARRTGTADRRILYHAAAIERALGNADEARKLAQRATEGLATFDPLIGPAAVSLVRDLNAAR
jgi:tetratricopeptide (TPR) repeat protein